MNERYPFPLPPPAHSKKMNNAVETTIKLIKSGSMKKALAKGMGMGKGKGKAKGNEAKEGGKLQFRKTFNHKNKIFWYPQHQLKAWRQLQMGTHHIDLLLEVRDARIPLSSINTDFTTGLARERLIIYNKADLANPHMFQRLTKALLNKDQATTPPSSSSSEIDNSEYQNNNTTTTPNIPNNGNILFTNARETINGKTVQKILQYAREKARGDAVRFPFLSIVVVGAPNVGKSTLINALRKLGTGKGSKVTKVGKTAGITTSIQTRVKISSDPDIYLFDTPGIFNPHITGPIQGLKIALTGGTNDTLTPVLNVADYLLFRLNNSSHVNTWPRVLGIPEEDTERVDRIDNIYWVAGWIAKKLGYKLHPGSRLLKLSSSWEEPKLSSTGIASLVDDYSLDLDKACSYLIEMYRDGLFGRLTLDDLSHEGLNAYLNGADESLEEQEGIRGVGVGKGRRGKKLVLTKTGYQLEDLVER